MPSCCPEVNDLLLSIDLQSELPLYIQIRNQIIEGIAAGSLTPGEALPSVRQMASDLGINLHTVNKVYTILRQEGFLAVHRKSGVIVNDPKHFTVNDSYLEKLKQDLRPILAEAVCRGVSEEELLEHCRKVFQGFSKGKEGGKP